MCPCSASARAWRRSRSPPRRAPLQSLRLRQSRVVALQAQKGLGAPLTSERAFLNPNTSRAPQARRAAPKARDRRSKFGAGLGQARDEVRIFWRARGLGE